jgi:hypothetical protein
VFLYLRTSAQTLKREARLFVAQADVEAAAPLINDFRQNGVKSSF